MNIFELIAGKASREELAKLLEEQTQETARLRDALEAIRVFGKENTGRGFTCSKMAEAALAPTQQFPPSHREHKPDVAKPKILCKPS